jgi:O-antigen/teichoic acid export membrane protein
VKGLRSHERVELDGAVQETDTAKRAQRSIAFGVRRGVFWKFLSQGVSFAFQLATTIALARLLTPRDYGLAAMVLVFGRLVMIFSDFALTPALVQRPVLTDKDRSTAFWTSIGLGTGSTIVGIAISGAIAALYGQPEVQPLFIAFSFSFLLLSLGATQAALLTRDLEFRSLEIRNIIGTVAGSVLAVVLAFLGFGPWAIISLPLATYGTSTILLWLLSAWRPSFAFSGASARGFLKFSGNVFGTQMLTYLISNLDNFLVGRVLGPASLGAYRLSYNLVIYPLSNLSRPIVSVLFPAFSRMADERDRLISGYLRASRLVVAITLPLFLLIVITIPDLVPVVLGPKWDNTTTVIQVLAWLGILQSLKALNTAILLASDRPGVLFRIALVGLPVYLLGFVVGLRWGIVGVALGATIAASIIQPLYTIAAARALGIRSLEVVDQCGRVILAAAGSFALVLVLRLVLVDLDLSAAARLPMLVLTFVLLYGTIVLAAEPRLRDEARWFRGRA